MRNLSMVVEYDGTHFFGWQYQPNKRTVQGELQTALKKITGDSVKLTGAGRTDQGVHALGQVANFHTDSSLPLLSVKRGVNANIGDDVRVKDIAIVPDDFNSRYSAKAKIYHYHITLEPSPFRLRYYWYLKQEPDVPTMLKILPRLIGQRDFQNFSVRNGSDNTVCNVIDIEVTHEDNKMLVRVEGDRFLRKMIRGIVGFLVDAGRGRFTPADVEKCFGDQKPNIYFAPPQGLFLVAVKY
jgi:tRNA pseudouridine38-40 synthase